MGNGEKYIPVLESALGVKNLTLIAEKPLIHGNVIYKGELNGVKCVVKYSVNDPDSVRCEYECAKRLYAGMPEHIVKPLAFAPIADGAAYVCEWIDGTGMHIHLANNEVSIEQIEDFASQLDKITDYFLSIGFAHRDFGLTNVMLSKDEKLKVIDFQNSGFVGEEDFAAKKAFREIRSYVYAYRTRTKGFAVGVFNDRVHFLSYLNRDSLIYQVLSEKWKSTLHRSSLRFKVSFSKYVYMFGNFPMLLLKSLFARNEGGKRKLRKKLDTTFNTFRFMFGRDADIDFMLEGDHG
jgi:serine/threonine protein kinase